MRLHFARPSKTAVAEPNHAGNAADTGAQVTRGALALLSTQPLTWGASIASAVFLPAFMGDDGLGRFAIAVTVGTFVGTLASLGLPGFLMRTVATQPGRAADYAWGAAAIVTLWWLILAAGFQFAVAVIGVAAVDPVLVSIAMLSALAATVLSVLTAVLNGLGLHGRYAWSLALTSVAGTAVGLATLALGGGVLGYAIAISASMAICTVLLWSISGFGFSRSALAPSFLRELAIGGLPFLGWNVAIRIRADIGVVLTGILLQASAAGWLAAAYRIINITVFIPTVITTPLLPALSRNKTNAAVFRSVLNQSLATVLLLTVPISAAIFALAPSIPSMLGWSEGLRHAVPLMTVLAFQQTLIGVDMVLGTALIALGLERKWLGVAIAGAVLNPLLTVLAIPVATAVTGNGAIGAAVAEVGTEVLFLIGALRLMPRDLLGRDSVISATRIVAAGFVMLAVTMVLRPYNPVLAVATGGLAYLVAAAALKVIERRHVEVVRVALRLA